MSDGDTLPTHQPIQIPILNHGNPQNSTRFIGNSSGDNISVAAYKSTLPKPLKGGIRHPPLRLFFWGVDRSARGLWGGRSFFLSARASPSSQSGGLGASSLFLSITLTPAATSAFIPVFCDWYSWATSGTQIRLAYGAMQKNRKMNAPRLRQSPAGEKPANGIVHNTHTASRWSGGRGTVSEFRIKLCGRIWQMAGGV